MHADSVSEGALQIYGRFIRENDAKIYLAHGVYALQSHEGYYKTAATADLKKLAGNLFLGTTPFYGTHENPNDGLTRAVKDGLSDLICFETDFAIWWPHDEIYADIVQAARKVICNDERISEQIMHDNFELFIE